MSRLSQESALRKISDTGFVWQKKDQTYGFTDVATRTDSLVLFTLSYDLIDYYFPDIKKSELKKYLKLRRLPDTEGAEIIGKGSCFENIEATAFVRSFTKKNWEAGKFHTMSMTNLAANNASPKEKLDSFKTIEIRCSCNRGVMQPTCRPSKYQRRMFGDDRDIKSVPGSFMTAIYCTHADIGHDWLSIFYEAYGFGMHLPYTHRAIGYVVKQVAKKNQKLPKYRLNLEFSPERREIFKPLADMAWRGQISPA